MAEFSLSQAWRLWRRLAGVWAALVLLLALTCMLAFVPMGPWNLPVSLAIAAVKAAIVGLVFMALARAHGLNRIVALIGPLWLFFLFILSGADYFSR